jgi:outer membrane protein insertion porin family
MFKKIFKINFLLILFATTLYAEVISSLNVSGNKRISKESVIVFGNIELNKNYSENDLNIILKKLYQTNFFKSINLEIENKILNIRLIENPIVESLTITGIKQKSLEEKLRTFLSLKERSSFVESIFLKDINIITDIVKQNGYFFAKISSSKIKNDELNTVNVSYDIDLGKKAKISKIEFLGDKKIKDGKLRRLIASEETRFWKFISTKTYLDKARINLDTRLLLNYYRNNGYYNATIDNSFAEFVDNNSFKLIFNINAGKKYTLNNFNINVPKNYDANRFSSIKDDFFNLKDKTYSPTKIAKILKEVDKLALSKEFEFINSTISETIVENNKIDLTVNIVESDVYYVEKINILGNQYTLEEVIRDHLIVDEGDPFNEILFNKSMNNLKSRNYFSKIDTKVSEGSNKDQKIIDIEVAEQPTGEISLAAGVGTTGSSLGGGIRENNFLGKGITLNTSLIISESTVNGIFSYERPNFANTDNTLITSFRSTTSDQLTDYGFKTENTGFSLGSSFEQYENTKLSPSFSIDYEDMETNATASTNLKKQQGTYLDAYINYSLDYDLRDLKYQTTEGSRTIWYQALPVHSENYEIVNGITHTIYTPLINDMVGRLSVYTRAVNALGSDKDVRLSKRLYIPSRRLRGFQSGKIGPIDNGAYVGGNYVSTLNVSTTLPRILPDFQNTDLSLFFDAANVWGVDYDDTIKDNSTIRSSLGVALDVNTVIGPLNFSLSQPITKHSSDKTEIFRFNLGTTF